MTASDRHGSPSAVRRGSDVKRLPELLKIVGPGTEEKEVRHGSGPFEVTLTEFDFI